MKKKMDLKYYINVHLGLTYQEAAKELGFSVRHICRVCNGKPAGLKFRRRIYEWSEGRVDTVKLAIAEKRKTT